jgi:cell division protein FtsW (lipid II flippase)
MTIGWWRHAGVPVSDAVLGAPGALAVCGGLVLLVVVLIPFVGKGVNGARRWIPLGVMNFQPSELAKLAVLIYAADYMVRKMDVKERFFKAVAPMAVALGWSACCCWPSPTWAPSW